MNGGMDVMSGSAVITVILPIGTVNGWPPAIRTIKTAILTTPVIGPTKNFMTTIVERDSSSSAVVLIFVVVLLLAGGGLGFAYMNGAFGEKTTVIENTKTIENNKTVVLPAPAAPAAPASALDSGKPEQQPAH